MDPGWGPRLDAALPPTRLRRAPDPPHHPEQDEHDEDRHDHRDHPDDLAPVRRDELGRQLEDARPDPFEEHRSFRSDREVESADRHSPVDPATRTEAIVDIATPRKVSLVVPAAMSSALIPSR